MNKTQARRRIGNLIDRNGGSGDHVIGVALLTVASDDPESGHIAVSMDVDDGVDLLEMGISARLDSETIARRRLGRVTPTREV